MLNRVQHRVIVRDYGKSICKANPRAALLAALEGCIEGHESLSLHTDAGILQRDISINNLTMDEEEGNPSSRSFLIDLDLAIKEQRERPSKWNYVNTEELTRIKLGVVATRMVGTSDGKLPRAI